MKIRELVWGICVMVLAASGLGMIWAIMWFLEMARLGFPVFFAVYGGAGVLPEMLMSPFAMLVFLGVLWMICMAAMVCVYLLSSPSIQGNAPHIEELKRKEVYRKA